MSDAPPLSCLIYTFNEEINLPHCLGSLKWCDDVVVVDSFSTDRTEQIARAAGARFVQNTFTGFGDQRNWSLDNVELKHQWAFFLDADERVPTELAQELNDLLSSVPDEVAAYWLRRRFYMWGKWLRYSSLYPTWVVRLIRVGKARYVNRGHAETQVIEGRTESLECDLIDENHKGLDDWLARQDRYSSQEALYELNNDEARLRDLFSLNPMRRREAVKKLGRHLPGRPFWYFLYAYILRLGFLDGIDGLRFCWMKAMYHAMIVQKKRDLRAQKAKVEVIE
jgi:glycosyltransferase involved in cell wall biosynthesis